MQHEPSICTKPYCKTKDSYIRRNTIMTKILNKNESLNIPIKQEIFERADELLASKLKKHSKVFIERLDIHGEDKDISRILQRIMEKEKRKGLDPAYLAVREVGKSGHNHFHTVFFLNGNKTKSIWPLFEDANRVINNRLGNNPDKKSGLIDLCNHEFGNGIMIRRNYNSKEIIDKLSKKISYIAKEDQKEKVRGKTFFSSITKRRK